MELPAIKLINDIVKNVKSEIVRENRDNINDLKFKRKKFFFLLVSGCLFCVKRISRRTETIYFTINVTKYMFQADDGNGNGRHVYKNHNITIRVQDKTIVSFIQGAKYASLCVCVCGFPLSG